MIILGIETSCDETALSLIEVGEEKSDAGKLETAATTASPRFRVIGNVLISQTKIHEQYGGVFPMIAKREHAKNLTPLLHKILLETSMLTEKPSRNGHETANDDRNNDDTNSRNDTFHEIFKKEIGLADSMIAFLEKYDAPAGQGGASFIDAIAVTSGPGLEPALWVGINFARALGIAWKIPVAPVNHMEGHIVGSLLESSLLEKSQPENFEPLKPLALPALALLISGGHTELVLIEDWRKYRLIGMTRDDAVGEAFDKVARLLGLPYPGGPEISRLAEEARGENAVRSISLPQSISLPRPMIHSDDFDFSFSGLKTAVLYLIKKLSGGDKNGKIGEETKRQIAREFEDAATETLIAKTAKVLDEFDARTLVIGGGVIANKHIRAEFEKLAASRGLALYLPDPSLATDNAIMIALAGFFVCRAGGAIEPSALNTTEKLAAQGNLRL